GRRGAQAVLGLVRVAALDPQRLAGCSFRIELEPVAERLEQAHLENTHRPRDMRAVRQLREAATIAGKNRGVRIVPPPEPEQQLVRVVAGEQMLTGELAARRGGLDLREAAELAALHPRQT